jgi:small subunit ribosomal protein S11
MNSELITEINHFVTAEGVEAVKVSENKVSAPNTTKQKISKVIVNIFAKKNNTFITVTDLSGAEKIFTHSGGLLTKKGRDKSSQKIALQGWQNMIDDLSNKGITTGILKFRNVGGMYSKLKTLALKTLLKNVEVTPELKIQSIINTTPDAHGSIRKKGGRRGRRI